MKVRTIVDVSREVLESSSDPDKYTTTEAQTGAMIRIASALERIAARLDCPTTAEAARSIIRMDKRFAKRAPLGEKKARKGRAE